MLFAKYTVNWEEEESEKEHSLYENITLEGETLRLVENN